MAPPILTDSDIAKLDQQNKPRILTDADIQVFDSKNRGIDFRQVGKAALQSGLGRANTENNDYKFSSVMQSTGNPLLAASSEALNNVYQQSRGNLVNTLPSEFKQNVGKGFVGNFVPPIAQNLIPSQVYEKIGSEASGFGVDALSGMATEGIDPVTKSLSKIFKGVGRGAQKNAGRIINQLIKPREAQYAFGRNPGLEIADQGITAWNREGLEKNVGKKLGDLDSQLSTAIKKHEASGITRVDMTPAFKKISSQIQELSKLPETTQSMQDELKSFGRDLFNLTGGNPSNVSPKQALEIKRLVGKLPSWAMSDPKMGTKTNIARSVYGAIDDAMDIAMPETKELNSSISNLIGAKTSMKKGIAREENKSFIGLLDRIGPAGLGASVGFAHGGAPEAVGLGALSLGASKLANSTFGRTRIAKSLMGTAKNAKGASEILSEIKGPRLVDRIKELLVDQPKGLVPVDSPIYSQEPMPNLLTRNRRSEVSRQLPGAQGGGPTIEVPGSSTIYQPEILESDFKRMAGKYGIPTYGDGAIEVVRDIPKIDRKNWPKSLLRLMKSRGIK